MRRAFSTLILAVLPLLLLSCATTPPSPAADREAQARKIARRQRTATEVVEGAGWGEVRLGATRATLIMALGEPDPGSPEAEPAWAVHQVRCLLTAGGRVYAVEFNQGFRFKFVNGVGIGSPEVKVLGKYSIPDRIIDRGDYEEYPYSKLGVLFRLQDKRVFQFVIFPAGWQDPFAGEAVL